MLKWIKGHREVLSYLFFGVMTTLLNILLYALFNRLFGYEAANSWGNVLDNFLCILFAYITNRRFVFASRTKGKEAISEFGKFFACRLGTMILDAVIMMVGGNLLAVQGTALTETLLKKILLGLNGAADVTASSQAADAAIAIIGGADGPTAIFVTSRVDAQELWGLAVKCVSNVLVVVLNYLFSRIFVFKGKQDD